MKRKKHKNIIKILSLWNYICTFVKYKSMKNKSPNRKVMKSPIEFMEDKRTLRAYLNGNKTRSELNERGIKLAMPL